MNARTPDRRRNFGVIAHIDAGKTTLTERILWKTGMIRRPGEVHDGTATTDHSDIERERGITIGAAAVPCAWTPEGGQPHAFTLIDTPGHIDFGVEVARSLRVLDGAVFVLCGVGGVQPQSETVWRQARRRGVPAIAFVNKMDRDGANFETVLSQMKERLGITPAVWSLPCGEGRSFAGTADLVHRLVRTWGETGSPQARAWTDDETRRWEPARQALVALVADHDEEVFAAFVEGSPVSAEQLLRALRAATLNGAVVPTLPGSAFRNQGVEPLLDAVAGVLPSPSDRPVVSVLRDGATECARAEADAPALGLVFKIQHQPHGTLAFVRWYGGRVEPGSVLYNPRTGRRERTGRLLRLVADRTEELADAQAGDIVAAMGWKDVRTGDTLCAPEHPCVLESIDVPAPVFARRLTAGPGTDPLRLTQALARLTHEDPSLAVTVDSETDEPVLWGQGELHVDVCLERIRREWGLAVRAGAPQVAYREKPVVGSGPVEGKVDKQTGGKGQFARVVLITEPGADGVAFEDATRGGVIPAALVGAVERGVRAALNEGPQGWPVTGVRVVLIDGTTHPVDSSDAAFHRAAAEAVRTALAATGTDLLEPVMRVTVETPPAFLGALSGDIQRRRGRLETMEERLGDGQLVARVPLVELDGYTTALRSLSQGRASAATAFDGYEAAAVPKNRPVRRP